MKVTLVISTLSGGGAERVAANMANHWAAKGWGATIFTTGSNSYDSCYELHPRVNHLQPGSPLMLFTKPPMDFEGGCPLTDLMNNCSEDERALLRLWIPHILWVRGVLSQIPSDVVISYIDETNICVLAATRGLNLPVIVSEQCDPNHNPLGQGWELLRRRLYPQASFVHVLTEESLSYFSSVAGIRGRVLPNPVTPMVLSTSDEVRQKNGKTLLAMGRLSYEKGFDTLVRSFALVAERHADWTLEIRGEGHLRTDLESHIKSFGLVERVRMPGFTRQPFESMRRADLFVLSSRCEGFPNVLLEAMACGVPVVSFDCPSGPRHIIRQGVDGILVPPENVEVMAAVLDRLMGDEAVRRQLAAKTPEVLERFGMEKVMGLWEDLVFSCV